MERLTTIKCSKDQGDMSHCYFQNSQKCQNKTRRIQMAYLSVAGHYKSDSIWADLIYCNGSTILNMSLKSSFTRNMVQATNLLIVVLYGKPLQKGATVQPSLYSANVRKRPSVATAYNYANKFVLNYRSPKFHSDFPITLCTQIDVRRLPSLNVLGRYSKGPISVALFIQNTIIETRIVRKFLKNNRTIFQKVRIHLVFSTTDHPFIRDPWPRSNGYIYPINILRNVAIKGARTKYILYVEGDMVLPEYTQHFLKRQTEHMNKILPTNGTAIKALILPLFYPPGQCKQRPIPRRKSELRNMSYRGCAYESHQFMDYKRWLLLPANETIFELPEYTSVVGTNRKGKLLKGFEPYFVVTKKNAPYFYKHIYCFGDKVYPIIDWLSTNVIKFYVSPNVFLLNIECTSRIDVATRKTSICPDYLKSPRKMLQIEYARFLSTYMTRNVLTAAVHIHKPVAIPFVTNKKTLAIDLVFVLFCVFLLFNFKSFAIKSYVTVKRTVKIY
jgi:hypothetical protein